MTDAPFYSGTGSVSGAGTHTLFGQTMEYVAATAGFFALFAYVGRNLSAGWAIVAYIAAFACLIAMQFTVRRAESASASTALLFAFGALMGLALSPTLVYYASVNPQALWQAGGATALFMAACGGIGFATRRDLSGLARASFWALIALILFGVVLIFVNIPGGSLAYSVIGLVVFAGLTMADFQRLRRSTDTASAPLLAASIFLDALNVFLFFLRLFSRNNRLAPARATGLNPSGRALESRTLDSGGVLRQAGCSWYLDRNGGRDGRRSHSRAGSPDQQAPGTAGGAA